MSEGLVQFKKYSFFLKLAYRTGLPSYQQRENLTPAYLITTPYLQRMRLLMMHNAQYGFHWALWSLTVCKVHQHSHVRCQLYSDELHLQLVSHNNDGSYRQKVRRTRLGVTLAEEGAWFWETNHYRMCRQYISELLISLFWFNPQSGWKCNTQKTSFRKVFLCLLSYCLSLWCILSTVLF